MPSPTLNSDSAYAAVIRSRILARGSVDPDDDAWRVSRTIGDLLSTKYGATSVVVFGSLAKRAWTRFSDIDIAVSGIPSALFFKAFAEVDALANQFRIDLLDLDDCGDEIKTHVENEGVALQ